MYQRQSSTVSFVAESIQIFNMGSSARGKEGRAHRCVALESPRLVRSAIDPAPAASSPFFSWLLVRTIARRLMNSLTHEPQPSAETLACLIQHYERAVRAYFPGFVSGSTRLPKYSAGLIHEQVQKEHFQIDMHQVLAYKNMCEQVKNLGLFVFTILRGQSTGTFGSAEYRSQLDKVLQWCTHFDGSSESAAAARAWWNTLAVPDSANHLRGEDATHARKATLQWVIWQAVADLRWAITHEHHASLGCRLIVRPNFTITRLKLGLMLTPNTAFTRAGFDLLDHRAGLRESNGLSCFASGVTEVLSIGCAGRCQFHGQRERRTSYRGCRKVTAVSWYRRIHPAQPNLRSPRVRI